MTVGIPTGPADWHLGIGLWQWDHGTNGDYMHPYPTIMIYDYQVGYNEIYDLHRKGWGNRATCSALFVGPGYISSDHVEMMSDSNNPTSVRFTMDPVAPPPANQDHKGLMFWKFHEQGIDAHDIAGVRIVLVVSSPVAGGGLSQPALIVDLPDASVT